MTHPHLIGLDLDAETTAAAAELAARSRWVFTPFKRPDAARDLVVRLRTAVLLAAADPTADDPAPLRLTAELTCTRPDVAVVLLADRKLTDDDRPGWAAAALDLGAAMVLYPPVERSVLDDLLTALMTSVVRKAVGPAGEVPVALTATDFEPVAE
jgi:hypothetical protein